MIIEKPIQPIDVDESGQPVVSMCATEADMDWMKASRLAKQADAGDTTAAKELERMQKSILVKRKVI